MENESTDDMIKLGLEIDILKRKLAKKTAECELLHERLEECDDIAAASAVNTESERTIQALRTKNEELRIKIDAVGTVLETERERCKALKVEKQRAEDEAATSNLVLGLERERMLTVQDEKYEVQRTADAAQQALDAQQETICTLEEEKTVLKQQLAAAHSVVDGQRQQLEDLRQRTEHHLEPRTKTHQHDVDRTHLLDPVAVSKEHLREQEAVDDDVQADGTQMKPSSSSSTPPPQSRSFWPICVLVLKVSLVLVLVAALACKQPVDFLSEEDTVATEDGYHQEEQHYSTTVPNEHFDADDNNNSVRDGDEEHLLGEAPKSRRSWFWS